MYRFGPFQLLRRYKWLRYVPKGPRAEHFGRHEIGRERGAGGGGGPAYRLISGGRIAKDSGCIGPMASGTRRKSSRNSDPYSSRWRDRRPDSTVRPWQKLLKPASLPSQRQRDSSAYFGGAPSALILARSKSTQEMIADWAAVDGESYRHCRGEYSDADRLSSHTSTMSVNGGC
jgi:hypothetical protein